MLQRAGISRWNVLAAPPTPASLSRSHCRPAMSGRVPTRARRQSVVLQHPSRHCGISNAEPVKQALAAASASTIQRGGQAT